MIADSPPEPEWLEPDVVQFLHDQALREFGGLHGVRDENLLAGALARAANKVAYGDATLDHFDLAAAYAYGIARNHPFNDGNKRTAWASCVLFLNANGIGVRVPAPEAVEQVVALATDICDEQRFAAWLRQFQAL